MKYLFLFFASIALLSSCHTVKMVSDPTQASPKLVLSKGACFGECPVYTLTLYNSGLMKFNGVRYTKMDGKYERQMSEEEYVSLIKEIDKMNLWKFEDTYDMQIADLPTITLSYVSKDKNKTIKGKSDMPDELYNLSKRLEALVFDHEWDLVEAPVDREEEKPVLIKDEIIIKGTNQMILVKWLKKYEQYKIRIGKRMGPESEYWMIRYDTDLIDPEAMLKLIQEDPEIEEAEFNAVIKPRN